jgi:hypothetical protein
VSRVRFHLTFGTQTDHKEKNEDNQHTANRRHGAAWSKTHVACEPKILQNRNPNSQTRVLDVYYTELFRGELDGVEMVTGLGLRTQHDVVRG